MNKFEFIPGYEHLYSVNRIGEVLAHFKIRKVGKTENLRLYKEKIMKTNIINGYKSVKLCKGGKISNKGVHVLVALTFCDGYKDGLVVNHKDADKLNNLWSNLEWVTQKRNSTHAAENGMYKVGGDNGRARIVLDLATGIYYGCVTEAAKAKGLSRSLLSHYLRGICQNKTSLTYA